MKQGGLIVVRGGGDLATGTIYKLYQCGYRILILECAHPSAIRRYVAFSEAVWGGEATVEGVTCRLAADWEQASGFLDKERIAMMVDETAEVLKQAHPDVLIDAIIAKRNLGTNRHMADVTIALGPGFEAGVDVDAVVETKRGHRLGRVLYEGSAIPNTGVPGVIGGYGKERVIHAQTAGILYGRKQISDIVEAGEVIAVIERDGESTEVRASLTGVLRGLIRDGFPVTKGFKIADIDPRLSEQQNCFTISDKARCIAGGVLEAMLHLQMEKRM